MTARPLRADGRNGCRGNPLASSPSCDVHAPFCLLLPAACMPFARHVGTRIAHQNLMQPRNSRRVAIAGACFVAILTTPLSAEQQPESAQRQTAAPDHTEMRGWDLMQDGVAFFTFNKQGGDRGGTDFKSQNWWMGMAGRP